MYVQYLGSFSVTHVEWSGLFGEHESRDHLEIDRGWRRHYIIRAVVMPVEYREAIAGHSQIPGQIPRSRLSHTATMRL